MSAPGNEPQSVKSILVQIEQPLHANAFAASQKVHLKRCAAAFTLLSAMNTEPDGTITDGHHRRRNSPMAKTQDFTTMMIDMMGTFPMYTAFIENAFKSQAALSEKLSSVYLDAADKTTVLTTKFTKDTLAKVGVLAEVKDEPADYAKAVTDFASAFAELSADAFSAYAEIAQKVQSETMELIMAAGKELSEEAQATAPKGAQDVTAAAKESTQEVTAAVKPEIAQHQDVPAAAKKPTQEVATAVNPETAQQQDVTAAPRRSLKRPAHQ